MKIELKFVAISPHEKEERSRRLQNLLFTGAKRLAIEAAKTLSASIEQPTIITKPVGNL